MAYFAQGTKIGLYTSVEADVGMLAKTKEKIHLLSCYKQEVGR